MHNNKNFKSNTIMMAIMMVLASCQAIGQPTGSGAIKGTIQDTSQNPIPDVNVELIDQRDGTVTNENGRFIIESLPAGDYRISVNKVGYERVKQTVTVEASTTSTVSIQLTRKDVTFESVTVTGSPVPREPLKTTADVGLLAGEEKANEEQASMGATVNQMAGVNNISTGTQTGKPVIRGLSGTRIRMLHNNIAMDHQQYGVRHMPNMDPFLASRIELVQGPSSVLYGSDAMGGVINFITPGVPDDPSGNGVLKGHIVGGYRTNNDQLNSGLRLKGANNGWGFDAAIVRRSAGNITTPDVRTFDDPDGERGDPRFSGDLDHTDFDQLNGRFSAGYDGEFGEFSLNYTRWRNEHNFLLPNGKGLGQRLQNDVLQGQGRFGLGNDNKLITKLTYSRNHRQSNPGGQTKKQLPQTDEEAHLAILRELYSGRLSFQHQSFGPLEGQIGLEYRQTDQTTQGVNEPLVPSADITNIGAFLYEELAFGGLTFTAGGRFDFMEQEASANERLNLPDSSESNDVLTNTYQVLAGSFGANYQFTDHLAIKANVGRGFRAPSVFDLHVDGIHGGVAAYQKGDPNLDPELNLNTDFSIKWRSPNVKAKATAYRNAIQNYIFLLNTGEQSNAGPPVLQNVQGDAVMRGGYVEADVQVLPWLNLKADYEAVFGETTGDEAPDNVEALPLIPANKASGELRLSQESFGPFANAYINFGLRHSSAKDAAGRYEPFWQFDKAFSFGRASTEAFTLIDAGLGFAIPWQESQITVSVQGQNLSNKAYRDFLDTYKGYALSPGRNVTFKVNVPFTLISGNE